MSKIFYIFKPRYFLSKIFLIGLLFLHLLSLEIKANEILLAENKTDIKILIHKSKKKMEVYKNRNLMVSYDILLSPYSKEKKKIRGDNKTP